MAIKKSKAKEKFSLVAPKLFDEREMGKTQAEEAEMLIGRRITASPMELMGDFNKYYMKLTFKVGNVAGNRAMTYFDGSEVMRDYISRMIARHTRRIDTVQDLKTKDGIDVRVKSLAVVSRSAHSTVTKEMRSLISGLVEEAVKENTLDNFVRKVMNDEMKRNILGKIRKLYPVRGFEFRKTEVLTKPAS